MSGSLFHVLSLMLRSMESPSTWGYSEALEPTSPVPGLSFATGANPSSVLAGTSSCQSVVAVHTQIPSYNPESWTLQPHLPCLQTVADPGLLVDASRLLLRAALRVPHNQQFLLLSEDCVPLYPAQV